MGVFIIMHAILIFTPEYFAAIVIKTIFLTVKKKIKLWYYEQSEIRVYLA